MTPAELMERAKKYAKSDSTDYFANIAKGTVNGALTGGFIGILVGWNKGYNIYGSALTGIIVGGIITNTIIKFRN